MKKPTFRCNLGNNMIDKEKESPSNLPELLSNYVLSLGFNETDRMRTLRLGAHREVDEERKKALRVIYKTAAYEKIDALPFDEQPRAQIALDIISAAICYSQGITDLFEEHLRDAKDNAEYRGYQEIFQQINSLVPPKSD